MHVKLYRYEPKPQQAIHPSIHPSVEGFGGQPKGLRASVRGRRAGLRVSKRDLGAYKGGQTELLSILQDKRSRPIKD